MDSGGDKASSSSTATQKDMDEFIKSAAQVLKMVTEQHSNVNPVNPAMKMLKKVVTEYEQKMALVDSGATHLLRRATTVEWIESPEVDVVVAGDNTTRMKQNVITYGQDLQGGGEQSESNRTVALDVDHQRFATLDMKTQGSGIMKLLLWGAAAGSVAAVLGGVPQSSPDEPRLRSAFVTEVAKAGRAAMCEASDVPDDGVAVTGRPLRLVKPPHPAL
eukprot:s7005_g2.t1